MPDKQLVLRERVQQLVGVETALAMRFARDAATQSRHPELAARLRDASEGARSRSSALSAYLGGIRDADVRDRVVGALLEDVPSVDASVTRYVAVCGYAIGTYTTLIELAFRLYDLPLRELAPRHLKDHAALSYAFARFIPPVIAAEFAAQGLQCSCVCPMCGIGACACVTVGRQQVESAWREAGGTSTVSDGFVLEEPRPGSPLAAAGVRRGDVLVMVDEQEARTVPEIQATIRKHAIGDSVRLRIRRDAEPQYELSVPHTSDNPKK